MAVRLLAYILVLALGLDGSFEIESSRIPSAVFELNEKWQPTADDFWFVEFYAPWCGHCKKLHPIWEQVGHALAELPIHVGRVDCTRFQQLATKHNVRGYPTIKFFRLGVDYEYHGDRTKDAIVDFALKTVGPAVRKIENVTSFNVVYNQYRNGGFFVFVESSDESARDPEFKDKFKAVADTMFTKAFFFEASTDCLPTNVSLRGSVPTIILFKDNGQHEYKAGEDLGAWINRERWPIMPEITYGNLYDIGNCCGRYLVLGVLDLVQKSKKDNAVRTFDELLRQTAKQYYEKLHRKFQFGWLDGDEIARSIVLHALPIPSLMVLNTSTLQFYLPEDAPQHMTPESIATFLQQIEAGNLTAQGGKGAFQKLRRALYELYSSVTGMFYSQPLLATCIFGLPLGILSVICYTLCSADNSIEQNEIYKDSDDEEDEDDEANHPKND